MRLRWVVVLAASGCGWLSGLDGLALDGGSDATFADAADDVAPGDAGLDVGTCESGTCGAPLGFQPVLFASDRATLCPPGTTTNDAIVDPAAPLGACSCSCTYQPTCLPQPDAFDYGLTTCNTPFDAGSLDGGCDTINSNMLTGSLHVAMGPFAPANACTNVAKPTANASTPPGRLCTFASCSACPTVAGFALCYAQNGDVPCPSNTTKHFVGTAASLSCGACSTCTSTANCRGTLQLFDDNQCTSSLGTLQVDGGCQTFNTNKTVNSVKYTATVELGTCTPGTSLASVAISGQTTICCP